MPLETAAYLTDLVASNPAHTDGLSQADSHARLIKSAVKATFPNFTSGALQSTQAQIDAACTGLQPHTFFAGTAALPGFTPVGSPSTGLWSPAANQLAISLSGVQALLLGGTALVTTLSITTTSGIAAAAVASVGAYSGGTGQLVPIGATLVWWDDTLPAEGGYAWANGQIIASANTVCPILLARWGTRFGGNGTTTMGVPDLRDTVPVGKSTMGAVASRALQTLANTVLGTLFGEANHILTVAELASHFHAVGISDPGHTHASNAAANVGGATTPGGAFPINSTGGATITSATTGIRVGGSPNGIDQSYSAGSSTAHNNVQPSTTCNYIIRLA